MPIDRRTFLKAGLGTAALNCLPPFLYQGAMAATNSLPAKEFQFTASPEKIRLGSGPEFLAWTYNGQVPGPEIRVKEGERIRVVLKNKLPKETTIHWHGLPVPNAVDGVPGLTQPAVKPGETYVYEFVARPAGTFYYHSHVGLQLDQGLYGPLIIDPMQPEAPVDRDYTLMLEDWVMKDGGGPAPGQKRRSGGMMGHGGGHMMGRRRFDNAGEPMTEPYYDGYAVNGRVYPAVETIRVNKGERVKLRLVNASSATIYTLSLAGHQLEVTHTDGNPVRPIKTDILRIGMGERYEVTFTADNPGNWLLAALEEGFGEGSLRIPVVYKGIKSGNPVRPKFHRGKRFINYGDLKTLYPTNDSAVSSPVVYQQSLSGGMHSSFWGINGRAYPNADILKIHEGERILFRYTNHSMMPHPMHLHGHFFRIVNRDIPRRWWAWKDTLIVPSMRRIDIEFLADNPGRWLHHCHHIYHMEAGMANTVVYRNSTA
jgi:multicopper oxidase